MTTSWVTVSVLDQGALDSLLTLLGNAEVISFDLETQTEIDEKRGNLEDWHDHSRVTSASFTVDSEPDTGYVVPLSHRDGSWGHRWREILRTLALRMQGARLIGHNLKYDVRWVLSTTGVDLTPRMWWDTLVGASLLDENAPSNSLKACAAPLMGGNWAGVDLIDSESAPWYELAKYNAGDTVATLRLQRQQQKQLSGTPLARVFALVSMPALRAITRMEATGLLLDPERTAEAVEQAEQEVEQAEKVLLDMALEYGLDPEETHTIGKRKPRVVPVWDVSWHSTSKWCREFYSRAVDAGDLSIVKITPGGKPSFDKGALRQQKDAPAAAALLEFRHGDKQLSYLKDWMLKADSDSRLHPTFNVARAGIDTADAEGGTVTGRLSSSGPNAQQIAKDLKPCFFSPPGFLFAQIDYGQMELRIGSEMIERCPIWDGPNPMAEAYRQGKDLHVIMAALAGRMAESEVTPEERQRGKAGNFGFIFGMQPPGFVIYARENYGVEFTLEEAEEIRTTFFDQWQGVDHWHAYAVADARSNGYAENIFGRRRRLPDIESSSWEFRGKAERQSINAPVQSAASDIMLMALADLNTIEEIRLVATVHDSVVMEIPTDGHEQIIERAAQMMLAPSRMVNNFPPLSVPLAVDVEVGLRWGAPDVTLTYP